MKSKRVKMERNEQEARVKDVIGPPDRYDTDTKAGFITYGRGHIADEQKLSKEEIAQQLEDAILGKELMWVASKFHLYDTSESR